MTLGIILTLTFPVTAGQTDPAPLWLFHTFQPHFLMSSYKTEKKLFLETNIKSLYRQTISSETVCTPPQEQQI